MFQRQRMLTSVKKYFSFITILFAWSLLNGQPSLTLSSASAPGGGSATLNLSVSSPSGSEPAALQWTANYPAANVVSVSATASTGGKPLTCTGALGSYTCVSNDLTSNVIANGTIASLTFNLAAGATTMPITLTSTYGVTPAGSSDSTTGAGGSITVPSTGAPPSLVSLSCSPASVVGGNASTCRVTLSAAAPTGGATVTVSSNSGSPEHAGECYCDGGRYDGGL